ncbi:12730_t:CDS:2 [Cetraspora pellucida]|uniref:12730_t:CDS:1 n=1 Tax=Cetraspora pellucida TaxID=1433469 RepID=A0A9N9EIF5_9GLOM|nr:12730_t:CDS:2 [Cetraspora pellucida]
MKIVDSYQHQIFTINRSNKLDNLIEISRPTTPTNLTESTINLIEISRPIIFTNLTESTINLMETSRPNTPVNLTESTINLMEINNLINISSTNTSINLIEIEKYESNISTNLMKINNLIEFNESKTNNLIELIEIQKKELIKSAKNLNEINQQIDNIEINITNNMVLINKENFNQLIKFIIQKDLKIKTLTDQNNNNLTTIITNNSEPKLKGFFEEMMNALIPIKRLIKIKEKAKKQVVAYCYLLVRIRNKFVTNFKLDLELFLQSSEMSNLGIKTLSNVGFSVYSKTLQRYKKDIINTYLSKLNNYFDLNSNVFYCFNIDDFYNIHEIHQLDTTTLSSINHIAHVYQN